MGSHQLGAHSVTQCFVMRENSKNLGHEKWKRSIVASQHCGAGLCGDPQALSTKRVWNSESEGRTWSTGFVTFLLSDSGCSRQREEHMQMPASVSERGVSQEWQAERVGQDERWKGYEGLE